jgi:hypothetical protein
MSLSNLFADKTNRQRSSISFPRGSTIRSISGIPTYPGLNNQYQNKRKEIIEAGITSFGTRLLFQLRIPNAVMIILNTTNRNISGNSSPRPAKFVGAIFCAINTSGYSKRITINIGYLLTIVI